MKTKIRAANRAIDGVGGPSVLAEKLIGPNATRQDSLKMQSRISKWRLNGIAPRWVLAVEAATAVPRHELAPDLYPTETVAA